MLFATRCNHVPVRMQAFIAGKASWDENDKHPGIRKYQKSTSSNFWVAVNLNCSSSLNRLQSTTATSIGSSSSVWIVTISFCFGQKINENQSTCDSTVFPVLFIDFHSWINHFCELFSFPFLSLIIFRQSVLQRAGWASKAAQRASIPSLAVACLPRLGGKEQAE